MRHVKEGSALGLSAGAARVALEANTPTQSVHHLLSTTPISKFNHSATVQSASLNSFATGAKNIFDIPELPFFRAILKPTKIISNEMPDGVSVCQIWRRRAQLVRTYFCIRGIEQ
jgi:hypothetical protein